MAPNLALSTHNLTQNMIDCKLHGDIVPTDEEVAKIAQCSTRTIRRHRSNYLVYGSTKAPSNGTGRPTTITPTMLSALREQLAVHSAIRLSDMATFLGEEFDVEVTRFSIRRALKKDAGWSKKITQNIAQERNPDLRDDFIYDQSPNISEALRNLCLGHADSGTFQRHYLAREICADTFAINLGEKQQTALIEQSCSIAHSISKRRPTKLTPAQVALVNTDPRIIALEGKRRMCSTPAEKLDASRKLRNAKARMKNALLDRIRAEWTDKQAVDDIQRQLRGEGFVPLPVDHSGPQHPAQKRLVAALTVPPQPTLEAQYRRRNNAIHAIIDYCLVEEGRTRCRAAAVEKSRGRPEDRADNALSAVAVSVFVRPGKGRPRRCFVCVGKALSLGPDDPAVEDLIREFYTSSDLSRHFRRRHLSKVNDDDKVECQVCHMSLDNKAHFMNHSHRIHGTVS